MAVLTITAAEVTCAVTGTSRLIGQLGETVAAGQPVYKKEADGKFWKMLNTAAESSGVGVDTGIALSGGVADQWFAYLGAGPIILEATTDLMAVGTHYYAVSTAGGIGLRSDVIATEKITDLGYAITTKILSVSINATGLASA